MIAKTVDIVETECGTVRVEHSIEGIRIAIPTPSELATDYKVMEGSDDLVLDVTMNVRRPHRGQEITQNGHTFEVTGVRMADGNRVQVKNETGTWEDWKER